MVVDAIPGLLLIVLGLGVMPTLSPADGVARSGEPFQVR